MYPEVHFNGHFGHEMYRVVISEAPFLRLGVESGTAWWYIKMAPGGIKMHPDQQRQGREAA